MGCDIHAVIEYQGPASGWSDFGEIMVPRDYDLFSALAFGEGGITDGLLYPPRGIPTDHGFKASQFFYLPSEDSIESSVGGNEESAFQPEELAKTWGDWAVQEYLSWGVLPIVDFHTPSWLNFNELLEALEHRGLRLDKLSPGFRAVVAAMRVLAKTHAPEKVRLVFWFDG
jgi:hypothetical protein